MEVSRQRQWQQFLFRFSRVTTSQNIWQETDTEFHKVNNCHLESIQCHFVPSSSAAKTLFWFYCLELEEGNISKWLLGWAHPSCCKTLSRLGLREEASRYTVGTSIQQSVRLSTWFLWLHRLCLFGSFRFISSQYILIFVTDLIEEKNKCIDSVAATWNLEYSQFTDGFREACTGWDV